MHFIFHRNQFLSEYSTSLAHTFLFFWSLSAGQFFLSLHQAPSQFIAPLTLALIPWVNNEQFGNLIELLLLRFYRIISSYGSLIVQLMWFGFSVSVLTYSEPNRKTSAAFTPAKKGLKILSFFFCHWFGQFGQFGKQPIELLLIIIVIIIHYSLLLIFWCFINMMIISCIYPVFACLVWYFDMENNHGW